LNDAPTDPVDVPRKVGLMEAPGDAAGVVCAETVDPVDAVASQVIPVKHYRI
jgi:ABC-type iron transport system FetAB permease component